ncbi:helix-turn-helix domain-containing protein [Tatumella punctata]|uniref:Helix-turn-helix domain-containing protein n=1 Tax=Tatumella punctata TaxID=399969 RepID=A0ABW1VTP2_9GAMM
MQQILINREDIQNMLGGISRTTFYKKRKVWEKEGTPFPSTVPEFHASRGGAIYRYDEVIDFCKMKGFI